MDGGIVTCFIGLTSILRPGIVLFGVILFFFGHEQLNWNAFGLSCEGCSPKKKKKLSLSNVTKRKKKESEVWLEQVFFCRYVSQESSTHFLNPSTTHLSYSSSQPISYTLVFPTHLLYSTRAYKCEKSRNSNSNQIRVRAEKIGDPMILADKINTPSDR